jgi:divalent metal cation (Fe/Co/Zn/Cd) transporter
MVVCWTHVTALFQLVIVFLSGSVALADIHNLGDAATAIPLDRIYARQEAQ